MLVKLLEPLNVPEELIQELAQPIQERGHEFVSYSDKTTNTNELIKRSEDADIIMIGNNPFPANAIQKLTHLKLINVAFTGVDHVGLEAAKEKGIQITNAAGYSDQSVAELAVGLTLNLYRHILQGDRAIREEPFKGSIQGQEIKGKTVGIIGTGNIGLETAGLFKAFGATLIAYSRTEKKEAKDLGIDYVSLDKLLQTSDIVSIHLPLNNETKGFLSKERLSQMKRSAILINCARGPIVDSQGLSDLLNEGQLAGAGIDVFDSEPPLTSDNPLLHARNALLTPHVAYLTNEAMINRAHIAFANTLAFLDGNPQNVVQ